MKNKDIANIFREIVQLLKLHGDNVFKIRYYENISIIIESLNVELCGIEPSSIQNIKGITTSAATLISDIIATGSSKKLQELLNKTPNGIVELLNVRGIGPTRLRTIWQNFGIETAEELLIACKENKLVLLPGFGFKIQERIASSLIFMNNNKNMFICAKVLHYASTLINKLQQQFINKKISITGAMRRRVEIVDAVEILIGTDNVSILLMALDVDKSIKKVTSDEVSFWQGFFVENGLKLIVRFCNPVDFYKQLILQTGSKEHLELKVNQSKTIFEGITLQDVIASESDGYAKIGLPNIPAEIREGKLEFFWVSSGSPELITIKDLKGILHVHTTASDGKDTLEAMANKCLSLGYEYMGVSDHSQSAFYANGLKPDRVKKQQQEIEILNKKLFPFKILKGIESDILMDGRLDYDEEILKSFDYVIASVHSGFDMDITKATDRIIKAIQNPYTTILGHPTGRLLLRREGFPIDYKAIIDACKNNKVIIEINTNPNRLELEWKWIDYAISKNVLLSINPDAHSVVEINDTIHGIDIGRKGGLTKNHTFNAFSLIKVSEYLNQQL